MWTAWSAAAAAALEGRAWNLRSRGCSSASGPRQSSASPARPEVPNSPLPYPHCQGHSRYLPRPPFSKTLFPLSPSAWLRASPAPLLAPAALPLCPPSARARLWLAAAPRPALPAARQHRSPPAPSLAASSPSPSAASSLAPALFARVETPRLASGTTTMTTTPLAHSHHHHHHGHCCPPSRRQQQRQQQPPTALHLTRQRRLRRHWLRRRTFSSPTEGSARAWRTSV
mmetsp:Transcript_45281/g.89142  ORF Transcript_45281/g.89142 Transcript_45281/m.89142 type:complete len:228 (+) Transcript_45281:353-1036(+)